MTWTKLCAVADLPEGAAKTFDVGGFSLAAARAGMRVFVLENRCSHDDGPLGQGRLVASGDLATGNLATPGAAEIECPRHGGRFDLATGRATRMPSISPIETFDAKIDGESVWVDVPGDDG
ncbi:MAG: non-heme iron oxygenase ferredoxin subunit [Planctomycetes bacterium]|nr:non-heme iron oxygenase ferredoxin subunit [Planctomycetota bacterium]